MRKVLVLLNLFMIVTLWGCVGKKYTAPNFDAKTANHKLVAILPFQMAFTGKIPDNITTIDIETLHKAEGLAFQKSLYDNIIAQTGTEKRDVKISLLPLDKTNKLLQDNQLTYPALSTTTPQEICKKLGVDAIVYARVEKERFLTHLDTFGISVQQDVVNKLKKDNPVLDPNLPEIPGNVARSYHIKADFQLKNAEDGALLWEYTVETDTDWQTPAGTLIPLVTKKAAKKFPYRNNTPAAGK
jgi:hypothetical protein